MSLLRLPTASPQRLVGRALLSQSVLGVSLRAGLQGGGVEHHGLRHLLEAVGLGQEVVQLLLHVLRVHVYVYVQVHAQALLLTRLSLPRALGVPLVLLRLILQVGQLALHGIGALGLQLLLVSVLGMTLYVRLQLVVHVALQRVLGMARRLPLGWQGEVQPLVLRVLLHLLLLMLLVLLLGVWMLGGGMLAMGVLLCQVGVVQVGRQRLLVLITMQQSLGGPQMPVCSPLQTCHGKPRLSHGTTIQG